MNKEYKIKLDLNKKLYNKKMTFNQFDENVNDFYIEVTKNNEVIKDLDKSIITLVAIKPNNTVEAQFVEVENGLVYADLKPSMCDLVGNYQAKAMIVLEGKIITTDTIIYSVNEDKIISRLNEDVISDERFTLFTDALARLSTIEASEEQRMINEAERILSEENRKIEEAERVEAELIRQHEEADRAKYDATRESNENIRKQNEEARISSETNRIDEESKRVEEENKRKLAEEERNANYNFMTEDEERRRLEANAHKEAEVLRVSAENTRVNEEAKRRTTEQARVSAENTRVSNENIRKTNEETRQNNETKRVEAETQRQNRYKSFIADAEANANNFENYTNNAKVKEEERKSNELDRKSQEDRRISNEVERISDENTRKANENARIESEKQRVDAENLRKEKIIEIQSDYDSLKKVIIDENASANLQNQINQTNSQLEHIQSYITPLMFGGKGDYSEINGTGSDDNIALQKCLEENGDDKCVIDLMGKVYYTSKPLKLVKQGKVIKNGTIISDGNVFERGNVYTAGLEFHNIKIVSKNGYCVYCSKELGGAGIYKSLFINCKFVGKLGGFYVEPYLENFSNTFIRCSVESSEGNGFEGVNGCGTIFISCDQTGIPNGAFFKNCHDAIILNADSNGLMKHAILYDFYGAGSVFRKCNFEACTHEALLCNTQIDNLVFEDSSFSYRDNGQNYSVKYPLQVATENGVTLKNCNVNHYNEKISDILIKEGTRFKGIIENSKLTAYDENTMLTFILPANVKLNYNNTSKLLNNMPIYEDLLDENEPLRIGVKNVGAFFNNSVNITSESELMSGLYLRLDENFTNSFSLNGDVANLYGIQPFALYEINAGNIISITNNQEININMMNNYGSKNSFIFKDEGNYTLKPNNSVSFISKIIDGNLKWVEF